MYPRKLYINGDRKSRGLTAELGQGDAAEQLLAMFDAEESVGLQGNNEERPTYARSGPGRKKSAPGRAPDRYVFLPNYGVPFQVEFNTIRKGMP